MTASRQLLACGLLLGLGILAGSADEDKLKISKVEQEILDATNAERAKHKLPPLKAHAILFKVARGHSVNMAKHKKVVHVLDGKRPEERVDMAGYDYMVANENVGWFPTTGAEAIVAKGFMTSKVHRDNILGDEFEEIGIGVVPGPRPQTGDKGFYVTQVFGKQRKKP